MTGTGFDQYPIIDKSSGSIVGMLTSTLLMTKLSKLKVTGKDGITKIMVKAYRNMSSKMPVSELSRVLQTHSSVFVDQKYIVTSHDVLAFMQSKMDEEEEVKQEAPKERTFIMVKPDGV